MHQEQPRVALVGIHGYGAWHLRNVTRLSAVGALRLVAAADPRPGSRWLDAATPLYADLGRLLADHEVDVVVISTPIHTHVALAELALRAGADVLLEKPPAPSLAGFDRLRSVVAETGRSCQTGFQTLGSGAVVRLRSAIVAGELGDVRGIGGAGSWLRRSSYWRRAPWAGRRTLDGADATDGALTNPFAHAVATALAVDGSTRVEAVRAVEVELFHANDIEADDTSVARIETERGTRVTIAVTLCAPVDSHPVLMAHGSDGRAEIDYVRDRLRLGGGEPVQHARVDLLENLLAHRADPEVRLVADLEDTGGFMRLLEAVRIARPPAAIDPRFVEWRKDARGEHPVVADVEHWIGRASEELLTFSELGAPWAGHA